MNCTVHSNLFSRQYLILLVWFPRFFTVHIVQHRMFMYRCTEYREKGRKEQSCFFLPQPRWSEEGRGSCWKKAKRISSRLCETRDFSLYIRTYVCLSDSVFVSVCIAVPSAKRFVQDHAEVHEHRIHVPVRLRVLTEDGSIRREGRLHISPNIPLSSSSQYISNKGEI